MGPTADFVLKFQPGKARTLIDIRFGNYLFNVNTKIQDFSQQENTYSSKDAKLIF